MALTWLVGAVDSKRGAEAEVPGPEGGRDCRLAQVPHGLRQSCRSRAELVARSQGTQCTSIPFDLTVETLTVLIAQLDDIGEIFTVTARPYRPGSVSWGGGGGEYFLQRMNREDYARRKMLFENSRAGSARVTRSRR